MKKQPIVHLTTWSEDGTSEVDLPLNINKKEFYQFEIVNGRIILKCDGLRNGFAYIKENVDEVFTKISEAKFLYEVNERIIKTK